MPRERQPEISIDDLHPRNDGFTQAYKATWQEQGVIATIYLDTVERDHFPRGVFLPGAYELSSTYESVKGGALGYRQEEIGADLVRKLRERMIEAMQAAGWRAISKTREGRDIWQYRPAIAGQVEQAARANVVKSAGGPGESLAGKMARKNVMTVTRMAREVTFVCAVCGQETTQERMPGPLPRYCSDPCEKQGKRDKTRARVARLRAGKREVKSK